MPLSTALIGWLAFGKRIAMLASFGRAAGFADAAFLAWPEAGAGIAAARLEGHAVAWANDLDWSAAALGEADAGPRSIELGIAPVQPLRRSPHRAQI